MKHTLMGCLQGLWMSDEKHRLFLCGREEFLRFEATVRRWSVQADRDHVQ